LNFLTSRVFFELLCEGADLVRQIGDPYMACCGA